MQSSDFDAIARSLGRTTSRRQALILLLTGAATATAAGLVDPRPAHAATTAAAASTFTCSSTNRMSTSCTDLSAYVAQCGVLCPGGQRLPGKGGCTVPNG